MSRHHRHRNRRPPTPLPKPRRSSSGTCVPFAFSSPLYVGLLLTVRPTGRPDSLPLRKEHRRVPLDEPHLHPRPPLEPGSRRTPAGPAASPAEPPLVTNRGPLGPPARGPSRT